MKPIVVVAGIMDTKGKELLYIRDRVRVMGCDTLMIELSLGKEVKADWIDVHISDLLRGVDKTPSDIFAMTRGDAAKVVTEAAIKYITRLQKSGKMHALIAYCGGMGSSIVAPVMQLCPMVCQRSCFQQWYIVRSNIWQTKISQCSILSRRQA